MKNLFDLQGCVALVTGGSQGIGRMIVEGLLAHGARVYVNSRNAERCAAAVGELAALGDARALPADLGTTAGVRQLSDAMAAAEPALDILVCNAGAVWNAPFDAFPEEGWDKVAALNVKSPFFLAQALLPQLRAGAARRAPARVIFVTSIDAFHVPLTETYSYSAAKAGLTILTRMLGKHLGPQQIAVNAIAPGIFPTKMTRGALAARGDEFAASVPLRRLGTPQDMAGAAVFLSSRAGAYINGSTLVVDGGWLGAT